MSRRRQRTCGGKRRFRDQSEALRVARTIAARPIRGGRDGKVPVRAYSCPRCNGWHLTSREAR